MPPASCPNDAIRENLAVGTFLYRGSVIYILSVMLGRKEFSAPTDLRLLDQERQAIPDVKMVTRCIAGQRTMMLGEEGSAHGHDRHMLAGQRPEALTKPSFERDIRKMVDALGLEPRTR